MIGSCHTISVVTIAEQGGVVQIAPVMHLPLRVGDPFRTRPLACVGAEEQPDRDQRDEAQKRSPPDIPGRGGVGVRLRRLEAIVLCQFGGLIGVGLGVVTGNVVAYLLKVPPVLPLDWVVLGLLICSIVGIVFGTYPAIKAANLDPIDSLRYE